VAVKAITREGLKVKLDRGEEVVLIETLGSKYYEDAHLPGAINIPHTEVDALAPEMLPDKSAQIVVYCSNRACQNSPTWVTRPSTTTRRASRTGSRPACPPRAASPK
jgi:rhodanese-related sulfurtransferase